MSGRGSLIARCDQNGCGEEWQVSDLPRAVDKVAQRLERAVCPKCGSNNLWHVLRYKTVPDGDKFGIF